jgi:hypothetical protein
MSHSSPVFTQIPEGIGGITARSTIDSYAAIEQTNEIIAISYLFEKLAVIHNAGRAPRTELPKSGGNLEIMR